MSRFRLSLVVLSASLLPLQANAGTFKLLGFVTGAPSPMSWATNTSRDASKVVGFVNNASNVVQGCYWDVYGLHLIANSTKALAAASSGSLAVGTFNDQTFYWNGVSTFDRGNSNNTLFANVDAQGRTIVGFDRFLGNGALFFPVGGSEEQLPQLIAGNQEGAAACSGDAQVVVGYSIFANLSNQPSMPVLWDPSGARKLPIIPGYNAGAAAAVNDQGVATLMGQYNSVNPSLLPSAVIVADGQFKAWGNGGVRLTRLGGLSDDANCFVGSWSNGTSLSFIWTRTEGFADAATFLNEHGANVGANTNILVTGVSADGLHFCGACTNSNTSLGEAFLATINPIYPAIQSFKLSTSVIVGGNTLTGGLALTGPAPGNMNIVVGGGQTPLIHSLTMLSSGESSGNVPIFTAGVGSQVTTFAQAYLGGHFVNQGLTLVPASITGISLSNNAVVGGAAVTGIVHLNGNSPITGANVSLSSSNTIAATVSSSSALAKNVPAPTFPIATLGVQSSQQTVITATYRGVQQTAVLTVNPASIVSLRFSPSDTVGGNSVIGFVTMNGAAAGETTVNLSSSNPAVVQVPPFVTIHNQFHFNYFLTSTKAVATTTKVTITATSGATTLRSTITVLPPILYSLTPSSATVRGGSPFTLTVRLNGPAPPGGAVVNLSSSDGSLAQVPASLTIPAGSGSASAQVNTSEVASETTVIITGAYRGGVKSCTVTLEP